MPSPPHRPHMNKRSRLMLAIAAVLGGTVVFGMTLTHALLYAPGNPVEIPQLQLHQHIVAASAEKPLRLKIPALDINASVQYVTVNGRGEVGIPSNFTDVAWYKNGPIPGQLGSAIVDGHVDNGLGLAGVFKHLGDIKIGDDVYVDTVGGTSLHFKVVDIESYPYKDPPLAQIFSQSDTARLNLITCEGGWVAGDRTYDHRLVVYTELQPT